MQIRGETKNRKKENILLTKREREIYQRINE